MKIKSQAVCTAIKESEGSFEGKAFSSTTFHLHVDLAENGAGRSMGVVTRPFKFGDASEFDKWAHLSKSWPAGGLACDCEFDIIAGADNSTKLTLLGIKPTQGTQHAKAA
jgi:hypothetical protein